MAGAVVAAVTAAVLVLLLRRWVTRPVTELAAATRAVAEGQLDRHLAVVGPRELVELTADVDTMRERMRLQIDDLTATRLARDIVRKIEETLTYPGQIKVTVIRETRAVEYAK